MDKYLVLGNPISHSRSPRIHSLFAQQLGETISYEKLLVRPEGLKTALADIQERGVLGCNITVPFKEEAYRLAQGHTPRAKWAQAGNTLLFTPGGIILENTDGIGLVRDIQKHAKILLHGKRILILGAGGAAAGALAALIDTQPQSLVIVNRTSERGLRLVARHRPYAMRVAPELRLEALPMLQLNQAGVFDVVINATAASLGGEVLLLPPNIVTPETLVYDMMYGAAAQPFLRAVAGQGLQTRDGLGMLVEQAAESYYFWRGSRPDTRAVLRTLRAEIDAESL